MLKEKNPLSNVGNIDHVHNRIRYGNIKERPVRSSSSSDFQYYYDSYQHSTNIILNYEKRHLVILLHVSKCELDRSAYMLRKGMLDN
jgi:hypothetical protein